MNGRDLTLLGTRLVVAFIFLWHGVPKTVDPQMAMDKFVGFGLPGILGPVVGVLEVVAGTLLVTGLLHRVASLALAVVIAGALATVQIPGGFSAGLERDLLILAATVLLAVHGPGQLNLTTVLRHRWYGATE
jgi:putative oxidoreductase